MGRHEVRRIVLEVGALAHREPVVERERVIGRTRLDIVVDRLAAQPAHRALAPALAVELVLELLEPARRVPRAAIRHR